MGVRGGLICVSSGVLVDPLLKVTLSLIESVLAYLNTVSIFN